MPKTITRKKKPVARKTMKKKALRRGSGQAKTLKRAVRKVVGKRKMVKKVTKKVTKKLVKKVTLRLGSGQVAGKKPKIDGLVGKVVHYYDKIGVAIIELSAPLVVGDLLTFRRGEREFTQPISSMQINHMPVPKARKGDVVGVKVVQQTDSGTLAIRE